MQINILDAVFQTALFTSFLIAGIIISSKKDTSPHGLNHSRSNELKGLAVLMVIFSHIGYFLFTDHRFLFPLSIAAGVGVNIFLFLSGFGLTSSEIGSNKSIFVFYKKRLKAIYIPMWLVLGLILLLDYFLLKKSYDLTAVFYSFVGFFPVADIYKSLNSPLWYFSLILFYYLIFPLIYRRNRLLLSVVGVLLISLVVMKFNLPVAKDVLKLYQLHYLSFPIGMFFAYLKFKGFGVLMRERLKNLFPNTFVRDLVRYISIALLLFVFSYTAINSGIGKSLMIEQSISIITMLSITLIFILKDTRSELLSIIGVYSYEIYLIQWPILYRYDFIYKHVPAFLGTILYLGLFILIAFVLNRISKWKVRHS